MKELKNRVKELEAQLDKMRNTWAAMGESKDATIRGLRARLVGVDAGTHVIVPVEPTRRMIDEGAQRLASFGDDSKWPDSWEPSQVAQMRILSDRVIRSAIFAAQETNQ